MLIGVVNNYNYIDSYVSEIDSTTSHSTAMNYNYFRTNVWVDICASQINNTLKARRINLNNTYIGICNGK